VSMDKIEIINVSFDFGPEPDELMVRVCLCEWRRGTEFRSAYHNKIPDDVRVALALLVAPGLVTETATIREGLAAIQAELEQMEQMERTKPEAVEAKR
jgi:hypothetical protein